VTRAVFQTRWQNDIPAIGIQLDAMKPHLTRTFFQLVLSLVCTGLCAADAPAQTTKEVAWFKFNIGFEGQKIAISEPKPFTLGMGLFNKRIQLVVNQPENIDEDGEAYITPSGVIMLNSETLAHYDPAQHFTQLDEMTVSIAIPAPNDSIKLAKEVRYAMVPLAGKPIEENQTLFQAAAQVNAKRNTAFFSEGSQCLLVESTRFSQANFLIQLDRYSPYKSLQQITDQERKRLVAKLLSFEQGEWAGIHWSKFRVIGYKNQPYFSSLVEFRGKIYWTDFSDTNPKPPVFSNCVAYNATAIQDIQQRLNQLNP